jgi:hypothetical protein
MFVRNVQAACVWRRHPHETAISFEEQPDNRVLKLWGRKVDRGKAKQFGVSRMPV